MSSIGRAHDLLASVAPGFCLTALTHGRMPERTGEALRLCGRERPERRCPLHPILVVWLVLALPLYRSLSIANVFRTLMDALREHQRGLPLSPVTDGALAHARTRLGVEPLRHLFQLVAEDVDPAPSFYGRRVWAADGCSSTVPDRPANEAMFGRPRGKGDAAAFPQLKTVVLASTRTHELRAAGWVPHGRSEREVAWQFLPCLGKGDLLLLDRGFFGAYYFDALQAQGTDFLARARSNMGWISRRRRGLGDYEIVFMSRWVPLHLREGERCTRPVTLRLRMIEYTLDGKETIRLVTTLKDRRIRPRELIELYHERWDVELGFDEIKTHLSTPAHGSLHTVYRGRTPAMVEQELWATLTVYNLVRGLMAQTARVHQIDARRISFVDALQVIRLAAGRAQQDKPQRRLSLYVRLLEDLAACTQRRWRRPRRAPRAVRIKSTNFPKKKPGQGSVAVDYMEKLRLGAAS